MWQAIQYVTGGFTLCAFIVAAIASAYKRKVQEERKRIESALPEDRAALVARTLEFFDINTSNLDQQKQYDIAIRQVDARIERFRLMAGVVVIFAVLGAAVTVYAFSRGSAGKGKVEPPDNKQNDSGLTLYVDGVVPKIREILVSDRDSGDSNGIAGSCPVGTRANLSVVGSKIYYYSCAHVCFATEDSAAPGDLDYTKVTVETIAQDGRWALINIPCLASKGSCVHGRYGTIGAGTKSCTRPPMDQETYTNGLHLLSLTANAGTVSEYLKGALSSQASMR